uniref:Protein YLS3-like n=1 Tax=Meloidogyne hapla TaxID=6305 RepID=A0A1I8B5Y7_MELHA
MAKNCPDENSCKFKIVLECSPNVVVESTEATTPQKICCPPLSQTISKSTQFADGIMTFTYDNINCPTTVLINCSAPDPTLQLNAAIVANSINFLSVGSLSTTFPGTCNDQGKLLALHQLLLTI